MGNIVLRAPDTALIISGGGPSAKRESRIQIGGRVFVPWIFSRFDELSLELRTIKVDSRNASTVNGVIVTVQGVCQVKISGYVENEHGQLMQDANSIRLAAQHFIGASDADIEYAVGSTLEGHQRAILGNLSVEEIYRDRQAFAEQVRKQAQPDFRNMGLDLVSYTLASISDEEHYIQSLGVTQTELVKRRATEGKALHESEALSRAEDERLKAKLQVNIAHTQAAESDAGLFMTRNKLNEEVKRGEARVRLAEKTEEARQRQQVIIAEAEQRRLDAEAQVNVEQLKAMAFRQKMEIEAKAEADKITTIGEAEAQALRAKMLVDMERLVKEAEVYSMYGDAAMRIKQIEVMPLVAEKLAEPLNNTGKIVFMASGGGGSGGSTNGGPSMFMQEMASSMSVLNETCDSFAGIEVGDLLKRASDDPRNAVALAALANSLSAMSAARRAGSSDGAAPSADLASALVLANTSNAAPAAG
ncbi:Flotillin-2a [Porphyridium purpureum]|uniref:Flotillin-2a n=1 Tax=Porphyridium purpureum TaxID=35688 RepID=A0A5J4Z421_PORPP|nr:Flotillin-2a [Porphyridium purpureum]|eukprot:POR7937..scf208_2